MPKRRQDRAQAPAGRHSLGGVRFQAMDINIIKRCFDGPFWKPANTVTALAAATVLLTGGALGAGVPDSLGADQSPRNQVSPFVLKTESFKHYFDSFNAS